MSALDPRTPVLVGVGQASEHVGSADYRGLSAAELGARAASAAVADAGAGRASVAAAIDTVAGIRQFEMSMPGVSSLGRSNNFPRSVATRIGAAPTRAILEVVGGQGPQSLVTELAEAIAHGRSEIALAVGAEAISTARHLADAPDRPDFSETVDGDLEDRGHGLGGMLSRPAIEHHLTDAASQYAVLEHARRAGLGRSRAEHVAAMGRLFAPFTEVAARNPHAAARTVRTAAELARPSARNRPIADPYLRYLVARDQVNQAAAVIVMSVAAARRLGVPAEQWVFLHGHSDLHEQGMLARADLGSAPAAVTAARHALEMARIGPADLATIDLYSCFPVAVSVIAEGLGLAADDPRGLTVTGGLPFFGGAGNNYSMHAIAETAVRCRAHPGSYGFVGANGGILSKYSAGVYSTTPVPWRVSDDAVLQQRIDATPAVPVRERADGTVTVETYTVRHARDGDRTGIVVGRLDGDGERVVAIGGDGEFADRLTDEDPLGTRVRVRATPEGNRATFGPGPR
ncbi:acetyl-CoA acetyltransferase [Rhodococcus sp. SGAir0479]|uniref:acetyl-CoA acetyltransferase n=1 Tax=Rhodococcus sp. SGAir0479 TaxID=2567884 RepID=UPI0010CD576A|nr:acetyl-CoA acetyltransferase [Rhodococcus sp. SGAir0479]QCQ91523.1 acetyl-CoA acetyltransferase [Rhodococcus sp. SGAir0479]